MTILYMARQKKPTTVRSTRFFEEIADAVDKYADDQMLSSNAAVNKLLRERLVDLGYLEARNSKQPESS